MIGITSDSLSPGGLTARAKLRLDQEVCSSVSAPVARLAEELKVPEVWISSRRYATKKVHQEAVQVILDRYGLGQVVDQEGDDLLLDMHPDAADKVGPGSTASARCRKRPGRARTPCCPVISSTPATTQPEANPFRGLTPN